MLWILKRAAISVAITCIVAYSVCGFVVWDAAWLSEIATWKPHQRAFLLFIATPTAFLVFWVVWGMQLLNREYEK